LALKTLKLSDEDHRLLPIESWRSGTSITRNGTASVSWGVPFGGPGSYAQAGDQAEGVPAGRNSDPEDLKGFGL
jgi:hypothetical protein